MPVKHGDGDFVGKRRCRTKVHVGRLGTVEIVRNRRGLLTQGIFHVVLAAEVEAGARRTRWVDTGERVASARRRAAAVRAYGARRLIETVRFALEALGFALVRVGLAAQLLGKAGERGGHQARLRDALGARAGVRGHARVERRRIRRHAVGGIERSSGEGLRGRLGGLADEFAGFGRGILGVAGNLSRLRRDLLRGRIRIRSVVGLGLLHDLRGRCGRVGKLLHRLRIFVDAGLELPGDLGRVDLAIRKFAARDGARGAGGKVAGHIGVGMGERES